MIVLGAVLVSTVYLSVAAFTSSSSNPETLQMGDVVFDLAPTGAIVDTTALRPGTVQSGSVQVTNRKAAATFTLAFSGLGSNPLGGVLRLTVEETTPQSIQLYDGVLFGVPTLTVGKLATGQTARLTFTYTWPGASQDASLQGQTAPLVLNWNATT